MGKISDKIINDRLMWTLESRNLLIPEQSGFRKRRSAIDNLMELESEIHKAFANKQYVLAIFLDISKAYDTVWLHKIIKTLESWSIRGNMLKCVCNFLKNRVFTVRANGTYSPLKTQINGIPQGCSLSVTLFLIAINDIIQNFNSNIKAEHNFIV